MNRNLLKYQFPTDKVKVCKKDVCIEARGENGQALIAAVCLAFFLIGIAAIANALK